MAPPLPTPAGPFHTTRWSLVLAAGRDDAEGQRALEDLCQLYWPPAYAYFRRRGCEPERAKDLTQGMFLDLLARGDFARPDRQRGRFRTFLLTCAQNFLANEHDRETAQKRGGGRAIASLSAEVEEGRLVPAHEDTPDRVFERRWALALLEEVLRRLGDEYRNRGRGELFDRLKGYLEAGSGEPEYAAVAIELGISEGAVKVTVHRMRQRYRELLLAETRQTLADPEDAMDEIDDLLAAVAGRPRKPGTTL